jgi:hypothetical protein
MQSVVQAPCSVNNYTFTKNDCAHSFHELQLFIYDLFYNTVSEAIEHLMIRRLLGEWWIRKHQKGSNSALIEILISAKRDRQRHHRKSQKV